MCRSMLKAANSCANSATAGCRYLIERAGRLKSSVMPAPRPASLTIPGDWRLIPKAISTWPTHGIIACRSLFERDELSIHLSPLVVAAAARSGLDILAHVEVGRAHQSLAALDGL